MTWVQWSSTHSPCTWCALHPGHVFICRSFTVGQLQAHKHRLATCTPARSCSPPGTSHDPCCNHRTQRCNKCSRQQPQRLRPATSTPGVRVQSSSGSACSYTHKPLTMTYSGGAAAGDARLMSSGSGAMPQRGLLLAENVSVQDVGKVRCMACAPCVVCYSCRLVHGAQGVLLSFGMVLLTKTKREKYVLASWPRFCGL